MPAPIYAQEPHLYVFLGMIGIWILSDLSIGLRYRSRTESSQDRGSKHAIGTAVSVGVLGAVGFPLLVPALQVPFPLAAFWTGLGVALFGVLVRQYAVWTLREYFSVVVSVEAMDSVVSSGPYRWVRHPSYTGGLLALVGTGVAVGNWLSITIVVLAGLLGYGYRIRVEERVLHDKLGEPYEAFTDRTPYRLVPGLW